MRPSLASKVEAALEGWSRWLPKSLAVALDLIPVDAEDAGHIRAAQINAIVRITPLTMTASCLNATIVLATFAAMGELRPIHWIWAVLLFGLAFNFVRAWRAASGMARQTASRRAIRKVIWYGSAFGALWGVVPVAAFPGAPPGIQLFVGCLAAGMMSGGGLALATVPLAGTAYVLIVALGALIGLAQSPSPATLGIIGLLCSYTTVLIISLNWSASLFVNSLLVEMQIRHEVAARELAQAQSAHAERMTALGQLAGGIAHDFNNILQVVGGGAARIAKRPENLEEVIRQAQRIEYAVDRGGAISRRLLAFARRDALSAEPIDASVLLSDLGELLAHTIGPSINVHIDVAMSPARFLADRGQLDAVLLNLATNARDAMPNGGDLTISAASVVVDGAGGGPPLPVGRYVRTIVTDTGVGIDATILARVSEPFFTTKPKGRGTGLGLSMAKGFAEQSGGALTIASQPGRGTTVTLWLPQTDAALQPSSRPGGSDSLAAGLRVLVVEDEEPVRDILVKCLEDAGFAVLWAEEAKTALALVDQGVGLDALLTDFSMPGMNGLDLIHEVRGRRPGLPAILLTGHVGDVAAQTAQRRDAEPFVLLQKPMPPAEIVARLSELAGAHAPAPARVETSRATEP